VKEASHTIFVMGLLLMAHLDQDVQPFPPLAKGFACLTIDVNMQGCCDTNDSSEPDYGLSIYLLCFYWTKGFHIGVIVFKFQSGLLGHAHRMTHNLVAQAITCMAIGA